MKKLLKIIFFLFIFYIILIIFSEKNVINIYNFSGKNINYEIILNNNLPYKKIFYSGILEENFSKKFDLKQFGLFEGRLSIVIDGKEYIISGYYGIYHLENFRIFLFGNYKEKIYNFELFPFI